MNLFRRSWRVQIGTLDVSALDVKFKVKRTLYARPGTCELDVFNLTAEHSAEISNLPRRSTFVEVQAGYVEGRSVIFRGDLHKAVPVREGPNWIVRVNAGDGTHAIRTARVSRSFAAGTPLHQAAQHLADAMGVGIGNARTALEGAAFADGSGTFPEGTALYGSAATELSRLTDAAGLTWSIQHGQLLVLPLGGALERTAIRIAPDSGMLDAPEIVDRRTITVKALLQPGLVPGQRIAVDSGVVSGVWRISEVEYSGDTGPGGNDWTATMTCHRPLAPLVTGPATTPAVP